MNSGRTSIDNKYVTMYWLHQLGRNDVQSPWTTTSPVIHVTGPQALTGQVLSVHRHMQSWRTMFKYARLIRITYKFEWLGNVEEQLDDGDNTDSVRRIGGSETIWYYRGHETFDRGQADNSNLTSLAPSNILGLNRSPRIPRPDVYMNPDFNDASDVEWAQLSTDKRIKKLVFTPEKPIQTFVWRPITRMDKIAATWDLDNVFSAEHVVGSSDDDDQRCGAIGFFQHTLWQTGFQGTRQDDVLIVSKRIFRVTAYIRFKIFGARNVMRQVGIDGVP